MTLRAPYLSPQQSADAQVTPMPPYCRGVAEYDAGTCCYSQSQIVMMFVVVVLVEGIYAL